MNFEDHAEMLKSRFNIDPKILVGKEAIEYLKKHKVYSRMMDGGYVSSHNIILIIKPNKNSIGTLAHEMRHAWQSENGIKKSPKVFLAYLRSERELDANKRAYAYCLESKLFIQAIEYTIRVWLHKSIRCLFRDKDTFYKKDWEAELQNKKIS